MNGAEALIQTLFKGGVRVCFANPGTSEMQLVAAIDKQDGMEAILGLFEGVVTGAADGYARMTDTPAATLLHLGPGLANGLANIHNARRAHTAMINIVGDHAVDHLKYDAPLTSNIVGVASPMSHWVRTSTSSSDLAVAGAEAVVASQIYPGQIATVVAPGDHAWTDGAMVAACEKIPDVPKARELDVLKAAAILGNKTRKSALFLGGRALREAALFQAGRVVAKTGARIICETINARWQRGAGRVTAERLPYFSEMAVEYLDGLEQIVFVGCKPPVAFFAYPGKESWISPKNAKLVELAKVSIDPEDALRRLADELDAPSLPANVQDETPTNFECGKLTRESAGIIISKLMPENAIVSDESGTSGGAAFRYSAGGPKHDWLMITGGAIGQGLPVAVGAAVACRDRKVIALQADGSGMYTVQALWTMARENLDILTIIMKNNSYGILNIELSRVGVTHPGPKALSLLDLSNPTLNWVSISEGLGVKAVRAETTDEFFEAVSQAMVSTGPRLIEAQLL
ncbi:MAG: acetolactate synthase large subunit [Porticoccaceae bacterium]|mgnify:CR=1 FL=1|nr:acetolactate synthase large subunit [Porticoccaceae bacterium]